MADTPKHSVSVAGIVVDDHDRVLVIQRRDNGHWEPPGGVLELGETPQAGVRREVQEETGIQVRVDALTGVYKNMNLGVIALVFRCTPTGGQLRSSSESVSVEWKTPANAHDSMDEAYAVRVADAFDPAPSVRSHDGIQILDQSIPVTAFL